jgi:5'(3')-deoxyribonucleotidase
MKDKPETRTLAIDIDDVLMENYMLFRINEFLGTNYKHDDFTYPWVQNVIEDPAEKKRFYDFLWTTDCYKDVPQIQGAAKVLPQLVDKYETYIASAFFIPQDGWSSENHIKDKIRMLKKNFPCVKESRLLLINSKRLLSVDVQIDDLPQNFGPHVKTKLLFSAYHNRNLTDADLKKQGLIRVDSWADIAKILLPED